MDPLTLIMSTLAAGATASLKDTTSAAVKDAYNGLKALIQRKFADKADAQTALAKYEKKPDVWKPVLEDEMKESGLNQDQEIIDAAQKLMTLIQPQQAAIGKYNTPITGNVYGFAVGDNQHVNIDLDITPEKK